MLSGAIVDWCKVDVQSALIVTASRWKSLLWSRRILAIMAAILAIQVAAVILAFDLDMP